MPVFPFLPRSPVDRPFFAGSPPSSKRTPTAPPSPRPPELSRSVRLDGTRAWPRARWKSSSGGTATCASTGSASSCCTSSHLSGCSATSCSLVRHRPLNAPCIEEWPRANLCERGNALLVLLFRQRLQQIPDILYLHAPPCDVAHSLNSRLGRLRVPVALGLLKQVHQEVGGLGKVVEVGVARDRLLAADGELERLGVCGVVTAGSAHAEGNESESGTHGSCRASRVRRQRRVPSCIKRVRAESAQGQGSNSGARKTHPYAGEWRM